MLFQDKKKLLVAVILCVITIASYSAIYSLGFADFDDTDYVAYNPHVLGGLTFENIKWAFTTFHASNWHPLTWLSLQLDATLFGTGPAGFHITNLILHILTSVLLFLILQKMTGALWRSALVSALFAIHPAHVESVAWIAERKDVLSGLFWILCLTIYARYIKKPNPIRYAFLLGIFCLGIMAKPILITLPFTFLLLDFWPLKRINLQRPFPWQKLWSLFREKVPLFLITIGSCFITILAQQTHEAVKTLESVPFAFRIKIALVSYANYLGKLLWPKDLVVFYPITEISWELATMAGLLVGVLSFLAIWAWKKRPYFTAGWFWYLGTLVPVIGLMKVGDQAMADRYTYIPSIGFFVLVVWGGSELLSRLSHARWVIVSLCSVVIFTLGFLTWHQVGYWKTPKILWEHALEIYPDNYYAIAHLIPIYVEQKKYDRAEETATRGLASINAQNQQRNNKVKITMLLNLSTVYAHQRKYDEALKALSEAINLKPYHMTSNYFLVAFLFNTGNVVAAMERITFLTRKGYLLEPLRQWVQFSTQVAKIGKPDVALGLFELIADNYAQKKRYREASKIINLARKLASAKNPEKVPKFTDLLNQYREKGVR